MGAGPAGIFTAVELLRRGSKKHILLVEKGKPVEKRHCPKAELGHCVNCRPTCAITTGFSGAGAFSDVKLSLSYEVGGDLPTLIGEEFAQELIDYTDKIDKATGEVKVSAASQLAEVAVETAKTAKLFGIDPKVAVLSFSTKGSGKGGTVQLSHDATVEAQKLAPELAIDGELQFLSLIHI